MRIPLNSCACESFPANAGGCGALLVSCRPNASFMALAQRLVVEYVHDSNKIAHKRFFCNSAPAELSSHGAFLWIAVARTPLYMAFAQRWCVEQIHEISKSKVAKTGQNMYMFMYMRPQVLAIVRHAHECTSRLAEGTSPPTSQDRKKFPSNGVHSKDQPTTIAFH